jgi:cation diffusion facilitator family transporter
MKNEASGSTIVPACREGHTREVRRITWIGLGFNLGLAGLKFLVGILGSSQAVIADAVHSLSDMTTDFAVILGVKFWSAPPDDCHPYGHRRIEALVTAAIGLVLVGVAAGLGYKALTTIRESHIMQAGWIAIVGPALSIIVKEILYRWTVMVGKRVKSSAVIANAWHHRSDAFSSVPALIAVAASAIKPEWAFIDHIGALIVSLFILKVAWDIVWPSLSELADRGASEKDREVIKKIANDVGDVKEVHAVRTRKVGPHIHVDLHILVDPGIPVRMGHDISEVVKSALLEKGPDVVDVVVHLEPYENEKTD